MIFASQFVDVCRYSFFVLYMSIDSVWELVSIALCRTVYRVHAHHCALREIVFLLRGALCFGRGILLYMGLLYCSAILGSFIHNGMNNSA